MQEKGRDALEIQVPQATRKKREEISNVHNLPSIFQIVKYHHAAAGYPVNDTWIKAINAGNYTTWPGLTSEAVRKHFPESDETQKGHMKRQRQGVRSTKTLESILVPRAPNLLNQVSFTNSSKSPGFVPT